MVKFGRHLEFYQHNEQRDHNLYVVPYNDVKSRCLPTYVERERDHHRNPPQHRDPHRDPPHGLPKCEEKGQRSAPTVDCDEGVLGATSAEGKGPEEKKDEEFAHDDARFYRSKFQTDWRSCLASASRDFERSTKQFWSDVFDALLAASSSSRQVEAGGKGRPSSLPRVVVDPEEVRGALPDTALRLFLQISTDEEIQAVYSRLKDMHSTALINSEALRKLVKKFDKDVERVFGSEEDEKKDSGGDHDDDDERGRREMSSLRLSGKMLPEVYSANFNVGLPTIEAELAAVQQFLGLDEEENEDDGAPMSEAQAARIRALAMDETEPEGGVGGELAILLSPLSSDSEEVAGFFGLTVKRRNADAVLVENRKSELRWLRSLVENLRVAEQSEENGGIGLIGCLVGHRGFHSIKDRSDRRPLENSLMAYEAAWTNDIQLCECDIALTRDDRLILAHDENFARLALDPTDPLVQRKVTDLTYKEILSLPLKSGNRPPLLFDVLRSAQAIGGEARMIIEIKPGNCEAGTALVKMFARHPTLMERCAAVMSFDAFAMQNLRRELEVVFPTCRGGEKMHIVGATTSSSSPHLHHRPATAPIPIPRPAARMREHSSPDEDMLPLSASPSCLHGHRRGTLTTSGSTHALKPTIPTAMSIGDMHGAQHAGAATTLSPGGGVAAATSSEAMAIAAFDVAAGKARSDSIDQLGMSLDGSSRKDSFWFTPFGLHHRVPSLQGGGMATLIPPSNPTPLEPIPGGVRVEDATPHPASTMMHQEPPPLATAVAIPKLLIITRNGPAQNEEQRDALQVDVSDPSNLDQIRAWLQGTGSSERLDGLYMQYQPTMIETEEGMQAMRTLTDQYTVGIWGANPKPDDYDCFRRLVKDCGVSYVNSGLPKKFFGQMRRRSGGAVFEMFNATDESAEEENMRLNSLTWPRRPQQQSSGHLGLPW